MKLTFALFILAVVLTATASVGMSVWDGHIGHLRDSSTRAIHYDANYDLSSQRRMPKQ